MGPVGMKTYEAWNTEDGAVLFPSTERDAYLRNPAIRALDRLFELEAATYEEALAVFNLRMGFGPYTPGGEPEPCPRCGAWFYPGGSGECWRCGKVC